eukprot:jgi/Ulvmu1/9350/UM050_0102.1
MSQSHCCNLDQTVDPDQTSLDTIDGTSVSHTCASTQQPGDETRMDGSTSVHLLRRDAVSSLPTAEARVSHAAVQAASRGSFVTDKSDAPHALAAQQALGARSNDDSTAACGSQQAPASPTPSLRPTPTTAKAGAHRTALPDDPSVPPDANTSESQTSLTGSGSHTAPSCMPEEVQAVEHQSSARCSSAGSVSPCLTVPPATELQQGITEIWCQQPPSSIAGRCHSSHAGCPGHPALRPAAGTTLERSSSATGLARQDGGRCSVPASRGHCSADMSATSPARSAEDIQSEGLHQGRVRADHESSPRGQSRSERASHSSCGSLLLNGPLQMLAAMPEHLAELADSVGGQAEGAAWPGASAALAASVCSAAPRAAAQPAAASPWRQICTASQDVCVDHHSPAQSHCARFQRVRSQSAACNDLGDSDVEGASGASLGTEGHAQPERDQGQTCHTGPNVWPADSVAAGGFDKHSDGSSGRHGVPVPSPCLGQRLPEPAPRGHHTIQSDDCLAAAWHGARGSCVGHVEGAQAAAHQGSACFHQTKLSSVEPCATTAPCAGPSPSPDVLTGNVECEAKERGLSGRAGPGHAPSRASRERGRAALGAHDCQAPEGSGRSLNGGQRAHEAPDAVEQAFSQASLASTAYAEQDAGDAQADVLCMAPVDPRGHEAIAASQASFEADGAAAAGTPQRRSSPLASRRGSKGDQAQQDSARGLGLHFAPAVPAEALDRMALQTIQDHIPATLMICACADDGEALTGSSLNVTPPVAAVTPSKRDARAHQRSCPAPDLSLSDASIIPAARRLNNQAPASFASTASLPAASQDPSSKKMHVSRVLIGHQNPLYNSSPGAKSDPCTPPHSDEQSDEQHEPLTQGHDTKISCEQLPEPGSADEHQPDNDSPHTERRRTVADLTRAFQLSPKERSQKSDSTEALGHEKTLTSSSRGTGVEAGTDTDADQKKTAPLFGRAEPARSWSKSAHCPWLPEDAGCPLGNTDEDAFQRQQAHPQTLGELCPTAALQVFDSRLTNSTIGEHLSMAWPAHTNTCGPFPAHHGGSDAACRLRESLAGQHSMLSTTLHMAAAARVRSGQRQPAADPLALPIVAVPSGLSTYVNKACVSVDPLLPLPAEEKQHVPTAAASDERSAASMREGAPRLDKMAVSDAARWSDVAITPAEAATTQADGERVSFEIIEDEEQVQSILGSGGSPAGRGACSSGRAQCSNGGGSSREASFAQRGSDRGRGCAAADGDFDAALMDCVQGLQGATTPPPQQASAAESSCAPLECSQSVTGAQVDAPRSPRSPGGSAQASAARAGAHVNAVRCELRPDAGARPNVRTMAGKVRQRVDSETARAVRECAADLVTHDEGGDPNGVTHDAGAAGPSAQAPHGDPPAGITGQLHRSESSGSAGLSQDLVITLSCQLHAPPKHCLPDLSHPPDVPPRVPRRPLRRPAAAPSQRGPPAADSASGEKRAVEPAAGLRRGAAPFPHALDASRAPGAVLGVPARPAQSLRQERAVSHGPASPASRWLWARGAVSGKASSQWPALFRKKPSATSATRSGGSAASVALKPVLEPPRRRTRDMRSQVQQLSPEQALQARAVAERAVEHVQTLLATRQRGVGERDAAGQVTPPALGSVERPPASPAACRSGLLSPYGVGIGRPTTVAGQSAPAGMHTDRDECGKLVTEVAVREPRRSAQQLSCEQHAVPSRLPASGTCIRASVADARSSARTASSAACSVADVVVLPEGGHAGGSARKSLGCSMAEVVMLHSADASPRTAGALESRKTHTSNDQVQASSTKRSVWVPGHLLPPKDDIHDAPLVAMASPSTPHQSPVHGATRTQAPRKAEETNSATYVRGFGRGGTQRRAGGVTHNRPDAYQRRCTKTRTSPPTFRAQPPQIPLEERCACEKLQNRSHHVLQCYIWHDYSWLNIVTRIQYTSVQCCSN